MFRMNLPMTINSSLTKSFRDLSTKELMILLLTVGLVALTVIGFSMLLFSKVEF